MKIEDLDMLAERWQGGLGESINSLANERGISHHTLRKHLRLAGYREEVTPSLVRSVPLHPEDENLQELAFRLLEGETLVTLAREQGVTAKTLSRRLKRGGYLVNLDLRLRHRTR